MKRIIWQCTHCDDVVISVKEQGESGFWERVDINKQGDNNE